MTQTLYHQLAAPLMEAPDKPLIIAQDRTITRGEFLTTSRRIAWYLRNLDLESGERVVVQVEKSPQAVMLYVACLQAGLVMVPLNTTYTASEVEYFLSDAEPGLVICRPESMSEMARQAERCGVRHVASLGQAADGTLMDGLMTRPECLEAAACNSDDLAAMLYTSGTTGRPKGAMLSHGNLASNSQTLVKAWRFTNDDRLIHALPIFHTHGLFVACNMVMTAGASMHFLPKLDIDRLIDLMPDSTVLMGVPTFYSRMLQSIRLDQHATRNMRLFVSGSAPLPVELHKNFQERTGHTILERYGMTETNMNTSNPYEGERKPGSVGPPLPGVEIRIADRETGAELPDGQTGMIEIRGPNVFRGYWRMPEKTASEFRQDGFFISGDLGLIDADGYLTIVGRDKDLVISGGMNVYPREVELLLDELPEVVESAVIGLPHPDLGEAVTAIVVPTPGAVLSQAMVEKHLADRIARYKQPKHLVTVESLPRNAMGKVQKNELRDRFSGTYRN